MQNAKENQTELINHSGIMNSMIFLKKLVKQNNFTLGVLVQRKRSIIEYSNKNGQFLTRNWEKLKTYS